MNVYYEIVSDKRRLVKRTEETEWHVEHGWAYNAHEIADDTTSRAIGVFYVTNFAGFAGIVHFDTIVDDISPSVIYKAFKKGIGMVRSRYDTVFATIPAESKKLISVAKRLGFTEIHLPLPFKSGSEVYTLLQYYK